MPHRWPANLTRRCRLNADVAGGYALSTPHAASRFPTLSGAQQVCLAPDEVGVRVVRRVIAQPAIIAVRVVRAVRIVGLHRACRWWHPEHLSVHDRVHPAGRDHGQPAHAVSERQGRIRRPGADAARQGPAGPRAPCSSVTTGTNWSPGR